MAFEASTISTAVHASNALTARWCQQAGSTNFVVSGAGLWPLLALLASAATDGARRELSAAIDRPAGSAQAEALELIQIMNDADAASAALGLWHRPEFAIQDTAWAARLPTDVVGPLRGQTELDTWARTNTKGLIDTFPLHITYLDKLVLATALAVKTEWRNPFQNGTLTWDGQRTDGLTRSTHDLNDIALLATGSARSTVTRAVVTGLDDVDVHLLLGDPEADPGVVIAAGLAAVAGETEVRSAGELPIGATAHGLAVMADTGYHDSVRLSVPRFDIRSSHDLCMPPERFGLTAAMDPRGGQFPTLHPLLLVSRGAQDVMATFSHKGFEAAAVTAFTMVAAGMMVRPTKNVREVRVTFDRPYGFLAIHRPTGLALVVGWITQPG